MAPPRKVPAVDSAQNDSIEEVVGNKSDTHDGSSAIAFLHILEEHIHKPSKVWPPLANGIAVAGAAGGWGLSASFTEIAAPNDISSDFDIHFISVEDLDDVTVYEIVLYAVEVEIARVRVARTANQDSTTQVPIQTPMIPANTQIQAKIASAAGNSVATIALHYHEY